MNSHSPGTSGNLFIKNLFKLLLTQEFYQPIESQRQAREYIFTIRFNHTLCLSIDRAILFNDLTFK